MFFSAFPERSARASAALLKCLSWLVVASLAACAAAPPAAPSTQHLEPSARVPGQAPDFALVPPLPRPPRPSVRQELYSVVMNNVNVQQLLFALARDARLNVDIHPAIAGSVTMNVHDQTMTEILDRVARQVDLRYELNGNNLSIQPDSPFLKHYRVDYPNISRDTETTISTSTSMASTGAGEGGGSNASASAIKNISNNRFWETLKTNLVDLLRETDKLMPTGAPEAAAAPAAPSAAAAPGALPTAAKTLASAVADAGAESAARTVFREAASVIANPETGVISVRATQNQHARVREFLDRVLSSARRQVLIEATIVEVDLSSRYQQGIDWSLLQTAGSNAGTGISLRPAGGSSGLQTGGLVSSIATLNFVNTGLWGSNTDFSGMLSLLESFGTLRVLSSPKLSVLNNQSSVLKVVDNKVYFTISVTAGHPLRWVSRRARPPLPRRSRPCRSVFS